MESCVDAMTEVLASLARGELYNPLRSIARPEGADTLLGLMPAYRGGASPAYGLKEIVIVPTNPSRGLDTHMGGVLLHDGETGELVAIMNASPITEIRTAAVSAVATRALARPDAQRVAILGAGAQARGHVHAMRAVLDDPGDPDLGAAARGSRGARGRSRRHGRPVGRRGALRRRGRVHDDRGERADRREALARPRRARERGRLEHSHEHESWTPRRSRHCSLFTDLRESCLNEAGDYIIAAAEGAVGPDHIKAELGEVLARNAPRPRARGRADGLQVARHRSRGPRVGRARRPPRARARRRRRGSF